ncbi:MAG: class I SAM-dependent methyltransferase [Pseudomonadota bacterium]
MTKQERFWDWIANRYARSPVKDEAAYQRKLAITQSHFTPESDVLEFGAGTGTTAIHHAPKVRHIHAIDISSKMIEIAEEKTRAAGVENITYEQANMDSMILPDASYDVVLGMSILHLVSDRDDAISKVHMTLRVGGVFISSTVCMAESFSMFRFIGPIGYRLGLLPLLRIFNKDQLESSILAAGFVIEESWRQENSPAVFIVARKVA